MSVSDDPNPGRAADAPDAADEAATDPRGSGAGSSGAGGHGGTEGSESGAARAPDALAPVALGLHHVAIAVPSIADARGVYEDALGMVAKGGVEHVADQRVDVLVLFAGTQRIELVEPAAEDSPISKFLERSGGRAGLHHLAWRVADCADAIARVQAAGAQMIDTAPRPGSHGTTIAFVHPRSTGGVLMELVEDPAFDG